MKIAFNVYTVCDLFNQFSQNLLQHMDAFTVRTPRRNKH